MRILAFDPSTKRLGVAVLDDGALIHTEAFAPIVGGHSLTLADIRADKLMQIHDKVTELIEVWVPEAIAIETSEGWQRDSADGYQSVEALAEARGAIKIAARRAGVRIIQMDAQRARSLVCGHARLPKAMVPDYLKLRGVEVPMVPKGVRDTTPVPDLDVSDAITCGLGVYAEELAKSLIGRIQKQGV